MKKTSSLDTHALKQIKERMENMGVFNEEETLTLNKKTHDIDAKTLINNHRLKRYAGMTEKQQYSKEGLALVLEIQFENAQILNEKFKVIQFLYEDIYKRIETIGQDIGLMCSHLEVMSKGDVK